MISLERVVLKMADEIGQAREADDPKRVREHVRAIRLLADLVLDEEPKKRIAEPEVSDLELRQMMGSRVEKRKEEPDYGQSDSDSLLDF